MNNDYNRWMKDKNVLIVGLGRSGIASLEAALELGAHVSIQDSKKAEEIDPGFLSRLDGNRVRAFFGILPEDMGEYDILILSPGVPPNLPFIEEARACGSEIIGELEFAYRISKAHFIGITGTNGKTTTTTLVGEISKAAGRDTHIVGNIGEPVVRPAATADDNSWMVTEVSSFQLETTEEFRPEVSAILNLTPDHLDRHGSMEGYGAAKAMIFRRQSSDQYCVVNRDDDQCYALVKDCPAKVVPFSRIEELDFGAFVKDDRIVIKNEDGKIIDICQTTDLKIPGTHNLENALAAAAIAYFSGIDPETIAATFRTFGGVEHRIEPCGQINGVRFYNDSKGTNTDAAIKAIEALDKNIILIAGGYDKKAEYGDMVEVMKGRVKTLVLMGQTAEKIKKAAQEGGMDDIRMCSDMNECVATAWDAAKEGDVILLSPACASWGMYNNFEERGEDFKGCVRRLQR